MLSTKSPGRGLPGVVGGEFHAVLPADIQRGEAGAAQIVIERADRRIADHVAGPLHRKRRDRQAARQGFEQNEAERVGLARKHEDIGGRVDVRQLLAMLFAEEDRVRIGLLQRDTRRAVTDDHLGAGQLEVEERLEILLHRDPTDREEHRRRQAEIDRAGMEQMGVDAARPQHDIVEAALGQLTGERRRRRHHGAAGAMESAQRPPDQRARHRHAGADIFGKAGVEAGREGQLALPAIAADHQADRPLRRDVDAVRARLFDQLRDSARARHGHPHVPIARHRKGAERLRRQEREFDVETFRGVGKLGQRPNHTVDLRVPGVGRDQDAHQAAFHAALAATCGTCAGFSAWSAQVMISKWPSSCSTSAVQLSTQSPQFM
ncbi:hypothetical protein ACVWZK_004259 [Bradyrhizobium sp. GM0.4]